MTITVNFAAGQTDYVATLNTLGAQINADLASASVYGGYVAKNIAGGVDVTLSTTEAGNLALEFTGAITANLNVVLPNWARNYIAKNSTTGAYTITVKTAAGTGLVVGQGKGWTPLACDGTNVVNPVANTAGGLTVGNGTGSLTAGSATFGSGAAFQGFFVPSSGVGVEVGYTGGIGLIQGYNRSAPAHIDIELHSSAFKWKYNGGTAVIDAASSGLTINGTTVSTGDISVNTGSYYSGLRVVSGETVIQASTSGGSATNMRFFNGGSNNATLDLNGNMLVGATSGSYHLLAKSVTNDAGNAVAEIYSSNAGASSAVFYGVSSFGANAANAAVKVGKDNTTGRSGNFGGTLNASGADYAEYILKAIACGLIAKGAVLGIDADGHITDKWSAALSYGIKSTDPNLVGGDVWGAPDQIGDAPVEPIYTPPSYDGSADPGAAPQAPQITLPPEPVRQEGESDETYAVFVAAWQRQCADLNAAFAAAQEQYAVALSAWEAAAAYYNLDQQAHAARVELAEAAHAAVMASYETEKAAFAERLELARQTVDRVAFSGIVPVNVTGAMPGDYIVAAAGPDDTIIGVVVAKADMAANMADYLNAVGRVRAVLPDGRASVAVIVH